MSDIGITFDPASLQFDIAFDSDGDVVMDTTLKTAVLISLFSNRRASLDDILPSEGMNRQGWWGDFFEPSGYEIGSKIWLLSREKITQPTVNRFEDYVRQSLQWLLDDNVATSIDIETDILALGSVNDAVGLKVTINKPDSTVETFEFSNVWEDL